MFRLFSFVLGVVTGMTGIVLWHAIMPEQAHFLSPDHINAIARRVCYAVFGGGACFLTNDALQWYRAYRIEMEYHRKMAKYQRHEDAITVRRILDES